MAFEGDGQRREKLLELMAEGVSVAEAGDRLGMSRSWAYALARRAGQSVKVRRDAKVPAHEVVAAYARLRSRRKTAARFGVSVSVVRSILVAEGFVMGSRDSAKPQARLEFSRLLAQGVSASEAARRVGVDPKTGRMWRDGKRRVRGRYVSDTRVVVVDDNGQARYVEQMVDAGACTGRYLSLSQRLRIADLHIAGEKGCVIAAEIGCSPSTVSRELTAHTDGRGRYLPYRADEAARVGRFRPKPRKLLDDARLGCEVASKLELEWSPEQISAWLRKEYPHDESMRVSHETIYQTLYFQARGGAKREVQQALRTGRANRKAHCKPDQRNSRFTQPMVMIGDRPAEIDERVVPGHWEGDLITGKLNQSAIATLVERTTRYTMLVPLPNGHDALALRDGLIKVMATLPEHLRGSLTWDQGAEMARHHEIAIATDLDVYFCDPASPWQRGTNENTNGLLRQYFPKGTDLNVYGPEDLEHVAQRLNGRPRKTLDWDTPAERLRDLITADN